MNCFGEQTLELLISGGLADDRLASAEAHLAQCSGCRALAADAAVGACDTNLEGLTSEQPPDASPFLRPGEIFASKYRVEKFLGRGGAGTVVAARQLADGRLVAVKVLHAARGGAARMLREARALMKLTSEHIVLVHDWGRAVDGTPYIVMEYLEGEDLGAVIARGPTTSMMAVDYMLQICSGLADAHAAGVIHRDLKPSNIFVTSGPAGNRRIKLIDFGLAKLESLASLDASQTQTASRAMLGSPLYMSPEQIRADTKVGASTDVWGAGEVFYELLTGTRVFSAQSMGALFVAIATEHPTPPSAKSDCSVAFDAIVLRCLEKEPARRFGSIVELREAILAASAPGESSRRTRKSALVSSVVLGALLVTALAMRVDRRSGPSPETSPTSNLLPNGGVDRRPAIPFWNAEMYVNPEDDRNVESSIRTHPDKARLLGSLRGQPTAQWIESIAAVHSELEPLLLASERQAHEKGRAVIPVLVANNRPDRSCGARKFAGELKGNAVDQSRYRTEFVDAMARLFAEHAQQNVALILEPRALHQLTTEGGASCTIPLEERDEIIAYAVARLSMPNVFIYLDGGHAVGDCWGPSRRTLATAALRVLEKAGGSHLIRGFVTNFTDYVPLDGDDTIRMNPYNPCRNALDYVDRLAEELRLVGVPNMAFLVDTSRNGRSGIRATGYQYCNLKAAGIGERPRARPRERVDAYVWGLQPGLSDGTSDASALDFDPACKSPYSYTTAPAAGTWFDTAFVSLAENANPALTPLP